MSYDNAGCAPRRAGQQQVICVVRGTNNSLYGIRFNPTTSFNSGFQRLANGPFFGDPSCANIGNGRVTCAVRASDNSVVGFSTNVSGLIPVQNLEGSGWGIRVVILLRLPLLPAGGRNIRNTLEAIRFDPSTGFSSGFQNMGGDFAGDPSCANSAVGPSQTACVAANNGNVPLGIFFNP
jgi:hypothetical protein